MPSLRSRHAACSVAGRRRENEDRASTFAVGRDCVIAVVADGMGGANAGGVASEAAVNGFVDVARSCLPGGERAILKSGFQAAESAIRHEALPGREGMGTTLVAAITRGADVWVGNIGDSRAVLVLPDDVIPLSDEHSLVGEAYRSGQISELEAIHHPYRHAVSRALGEGDARPDLRFYSLREHGLTRRRAFVVLGSDGLFNHLGDAELLEILADDTSAPSAAQKLVLRAIRNGSDDNVSAAVIALQPKAAISRFGQVLAIVILVSIAVGGAYAAGGARWVADLLLNRGNSGGIAATLSPSQPRILPAAPKDRLWLRMSVVDGRRPREGTTGSLCAAPSQCFAEWSIVESAPQWYVLEVRPITSTGKVPSSPIHEQKEAIDRTRP